MILLSRLSFVAVVYYKHRVSYRQKRSLIDEIIWWPDEHVSKEIIRWPLSVSFGEMVHNIGWAAAAATCLYRWTSMHFTHFSQSVNVNFFHVAYSPIFVGNIEEHCVVHVGGSQSWTRLVGRVEHSPAHVLPSGRCRHCGNFQTFYSTVSRYFVT